MKNLKKICCIIAAAAMLAFCLPIHAYADAMLVEGSWHIGKEYQVNSTGVFGYTDSYVLGGGAKEEKCAFSKGDVVYVKIAVERMGITWGMCTSTSNQYDDDWEIYGWTDMRYLSPVGTVYEEAPVVTEIVTELVTVPPDATDTQPVTTKAATTSAKIKTSVVTMKVTSSETTKKTAQAVLSEDSDSGSDSGSFFKDNFSVLLIICVLILVVSSITLAAGIINYNKKKKLKYSDMQYLPQQTPCESPSQTPRHTPYENASAPNQPDTKYCAKCGAKNPVQAVYCSKCGAPFYSVNGKNQ